MRRSAPFFLLAAAFAFAACDSFEAAPTDAAAAAPGPGAGLTCNPPTLYAITPYGSSAVDITYSLGSTSGHTASLQGNVEVREVGTSTWYPAEGTATGSFIRVYDLEMPASGGTTYDVRAKQVCLDGSGFETVGVTSGPSNLLREDLVYTALGS